MKWLPDICTKTGKKCWKTYYEATRQLRYLAKKNREDVSLIDVFQCEHCKYYHLGHNRFIKKK